MLAGMLMLLPCWSLGVRWVYFARGFAGLAIRLFYDDL